MWDQGFPLGIMRKSANGAVWGFKTHFTRFGPEWYLTITQGEIVAWWALYEAKIQEYGS